MEKVLSNMLYSQFNLNVFKSHYYSDFEGQTTVHLFTDDIIFLSKPAVKLSHGVIIF